MRRPSGRSSITRVVVTDTPIAGRCGPTGGALIFNPGEACGWLHGTPTAAILDLDSMAIEFLELTGPDVAGRAPAEYEWRNGVRHCSLTVASRRS